MKTINVYLDESHVDEADRTQALAETEQVLEREGITAKARLVDDSGFGRIVIEANQDVITGQLRSLLHPVVGFSIINDDEDDTTMHQPMEIDTPPGEELSPRVEMPQGMEGGF